MAVAQVAVVAAAIASPLLAQRIAEAPEPNASLATATTLACGLEAAGSLSSTADEDWFRIVLPVTSDLRIQTGPSLNNEIGDTVVTLLDSSGGPLRASDDGIFAGHYSQLDAKGLPAGTYYAAITAGVHAAVMGGYVVDVRCETASTTSAPLIANEGPENNNPLTGGIATNVILPVRCNGTLSSTGHTGDWDFWRVLAFGDSMLRIRVAATAGHPNAPAQDLAVYLFDGATPPVFVAGPFFASELSTWDQAIDVRIQGGIHHVAVRGVTGSAPGSYYLDLSTRAASSATVFAGGCGGRTLGLPITTVGPGAPQVLESAFLGMTYAVEGSNLGSNGFAFHVVGLAPTFIDLTPFSSIGVRNWLRPWASKRCCTIADAGNREQGVWGHMDGL